MLSCITQKLPHIFKCFGCYQYVSTKRIFYFFYIYTSIILLGCTPQTYKAYTCPALRLKKQPRVNNRQISGLEDRGAYMSEVRS